MNLKVDMIIMMKMKKLRKPELILIENMRRKRKVLLHKVKRKNAGGLVDMVKVKK